ncbi:UTP--glucose-1-phosphate uridylyltransferase GalU [Candidatus Pyrohabitans sp.]
MRVIHFNAEELEKKGKLVKKDDRYEVYDVEMSNLVLSLTKLFPGKATSGHYHEESEEVYHFLSGRGRIKLGDREYEAKAGDIFTVPKDTFHQVINTGEEVLKFIAVFEKYEGRGAKLKAIIPAAGHGTRFLPITKAQPKEMLPVFDKPVIQYVVEEALEAGIDNILIITGRGKRAIEDHFDRSPELEQFLEKAGKHEMLKEIRRISELANITYIRQKEALGLGHAVLQAREFVGNAYFAVLLGDVITSPPCIGEMLEIHRRFRASVIALQQVRREEVSKYGIAELGEALGDGVYELKDVVEKPSQEEAPSTLAITGRYILSSRIFEPLARGERGYGGEIQLTDAIRRLIQEGERVVGYIYPGRVFDIGNKLDWIKSTVLLSLESEFRQEIVDFLGDLELGR